MPEQLPQAGPAVRERIQQSFARQGLMSLLGTRLTHIGPGRVHITLPSRPEGSQHGYVHAGATSTIAGGYAALTLFAEDSEVLTVEYKINLLAPAAGDHLEAAGIVRKSGRALTVCQLEVHGVGEDGERKLVTHGQQTLIRVDRSAE